MSANRSPPLKDEASKPKHMAQEELSDNLLSQSIIKRNEWAAKYKVSQRILFDMFSEFSSMMLIAKNLGLEETRKKTFVTGGADYFEGKTA